MARNEANREDLLAEGVNLPQRGRITSAADSHEWIVGWRAETAVSVFDGVDPVWQFNTSGQLRRVYVDGAKLAAENGRLTRLVRLSDASGRMKLHGQVLTAAEQDAILQRLLASLTRLGNTLTAGDYRIETIGITADDLVSRLQNWLAGVSLSQIAGSPNVVDSAGSD